MTLESIGEATESYEAWLRHRTSLVEVDLEKSIIAKSSFTFLWATYYRWTQLWRERCGPLTDAPHVLGVGDFPGDGCA